MEEKLVPEFPRAGVYRSITGIQVNLGGVLRSEGHMEDAEAAFREALRVSEKLAAEFPTLPVYREDVLSALSTLGHFLMDQRLTKEAEESFQRGLVAAEKLAAEFPDVWAYQTHVAKRLEDLAECNSSQQKLAPAAALYERAIALLRKVRQADPENLSLGQLLQFSYLQLGYIAVGRGDYNTAIAAAQEVAKLPMENPMLCYSAAQLTARCILLARKDQKLATEEQRKLTDAYAGQAVTILRQMVAKGYNDGKKLRSDPDFISLWDRPDFRNLLNQLNAPF